LKLKKAASTNLITTNKTNLLDEELSDDELVGTEDYISPEAIESPNSILTFATDLWSFGVILWQIFSKVNTSPFAESCQERTF
jgi:serine/threonine protein kinase